MTWKTDLRAAMQAYHPIGHEASDGEQRYKASPYRSDSDSSGFVVNWQKEVYNDFAGGEGGALTMLAKHLGIVVPANTRMPVVDSLRTYTGLADYAAAHGAPVEAFQKAGWSETTENNRPALAFPVGSSETLKYRYLDGGKPKFTGKDIHKPWYGLVGAPGLAKAQTIDDAPLVICNGEPSVVVAQWFGIPAVCIAGGESAIPDDRLTELNTRWQGNILVAMDCDDTGRKAQADIAHQFDPARVRVVDLGLGDKGDLADFCKLHGKDAWAELMSRASFPPAKPEDDLIGLRETVGKIQNAARVQGEINGEEKRRLLDMARHYLNKLDGHDPSIPMSFAGLASVCRDEFETARPGQVGLKSGLVKVDDLVGDSWLPGLNYVCLGDTGMGKTSLMVSLAAGFMTTAPGLICCTELPPRIWFNKIVAYLANVPVGKILYGTATPDERGRIKAAYTKLGQAQCHIVPETKPTKDDIEHALDLHKAQWLIIDSLNKLAVPGSMGIYERTCGASEAAQDLAKAYNLVVVSTSQVGRSVMDRASKIPTPNDGYGGGAIEQDARGLFTIYYHQRYVELGLAEPDPELPKGIALVKMLKHNFEYVSTKGALIENRGGIGFFNAETRHVDLKDKWS